MYKRPYWLESADAEADSACSSVMYGAAKRLNSLLSTGRAWKAADRSAWGLCLNRATATLGEDLLQVSQTGCETEPGRLQKGPQQQRHILRCQPRHRCRHVDTI